MILKLAASLDGRIAAASGDSRWITGEGARRHVHRIRARSGAILVGAGTARADDPRLNARASRTARQPVRVVVDSALALSPRARLLASPGGPVLIATTRGAARERRRRLEKAGAEVFTLPSRARRVRLDALLDLLGEREITSVLVEGGSEIGTSLLRDDLVDRLLVFHAPILLGDEGIPMTGELGIRGMDDAIRLDEPRTRVFGPDRLTEGWLRPPP